MEQLKNWDQETDVVVVGYGLAGGVSAITAHDAGASVLLLEKMPHPGGISILSGGGVGIAHDAEGAFRYLKRTCNGTTPDDVLWPLAKGMTEILGLVGEMAKVSGTEPDKSETRGSGTYPFPGTDSMDSIKLKDFPAYSTFPWAKGLRGGGTTVQNHFRQHRTEKNSGHARYTDHKSDHKFIWPCDRCVGPKIRAGRQHTGSKGSRPCLWSP